MPRVLEKTKIKLGADRVCGRCGRPILPGDRYLQWSFRYGGTYFRCASCPRPRPSELTQSKLSDVYAAIEAAEDSLDADLSAQGDVEEIVHTAGGSVLQVADEYHEAAEPFGESGENQERGDDLEAFADELESFECDERDADEGEPEEDALLRWCDEAREALGGCPL